MPIDFSTITQESLSNPAKLTASVIEAMENMDEGNTVSINDPNNGFTLNLYADMHVWAALSQKVDYSSGFYYPRRSRNSKQLYPRVSEFDYVSLMASPATVPFLFRMSKDWIIANSVPFDENYNKIQIPATSKITMGGIVYSMYYPIDIFVNRNTGVVSAQYNTVDKTGLHPLVSNTLRSTAEYTIDGITYFEIVFDMYQFERTIKTITVSDQEGFLQTFSYDDQFYAARVFFQNADTSWTELKYSLDQMYYDYTTPTALLSIYSETKQIRIEIPQIYFDNGQITQNLKVELYTTQGAVNYSLSVSDIQDRLADFDPSSSAMAAPLAQMPIYGLVPTTTEVAGGGNAMTYEEIRDAVINQRLYDRVAVTASELVEAGRKQGFSLTRVIDDLTDRMYYASNILTDASATSIPTFVGSILLKDENLTGNPTTITTYPDGYRTVLPTTLFKSSGNGTTCVPLSDQEVATLQSMTKDAMAKELNTGTYLRQPFHIVLKTDAKSPVSTVYNLLTPTVEWINFVRENPNSAPQMSVVRCDVEHLANGTGGYKFIFTVVRSSNIQTADAANFKIFLLTKDKLGGDVYLPLGFVGRDENGSDVWEVTLSTNYHLSTEDYLTTTMFDINNVASNVELPLVKTFDIVSCFIRSFDTAIPTDVAINSIIPPTFTGSLTGMSHQTMSVTLGKNLSDQIYSGVNTTWGPTTYELAEETVYYKTTSPIFQHNEQGVIETRWDSATNHMRVVQLYNIGEAPARQSDFAHKTTTNVGITGAPAVFTLDDVSGVLVGMGARGTNIPVSSKIAELSGNTITLDTNLTVAVPAGTEITFTNTNPSKRTTVLQSAIGDTLSFADTTDIYPGHDVFGFGIDSNTKVLSVLSATQVKLNKPTTEAVLANTMITFLNKAAPGTVKIAKGDIIRDVDGNPVVIEAPKNQYRIPAIMFDGRMFASDDPDDLAIVNTVAQRIQNYANQIKNIDEGFTEIATVYYKPARTMGQAVFGIGNNKTVNLSLELSFSFVVYVDTAVYNTGTTLENMRESIYSIVNSEIKSAAISVADLAKVIKDKLGANVYAVEPGGINGDPKLQLIALAETDASPSIEYKIVLEQDNSFKRVPNIEVTFVPKPLTIDAVIPNQL